MRRIAFVGSSSSGKATLARAAAALRGLEHIELDATFHQPGWASLESTEFRCRVAERMRLATEGWTTDGNYNTRLRGMVQRSADKIVWLDPPMRVVMTRLIRRTLRRVVTREQLWNGNKEPWSNLYSMDPEKNVIRWNWTHFEQYRTEYGRNSAGRSWSHLKVGRLATRRDDGDWLASLTIT